MNPDRWKKVEEIYQALLEQPEERQAAFLSQACGEDEDLRREVVEMLQARKDAGSFLGKPAAEQLGLESEPKLGGDSLAGRRLGVYEIEELIGAGGMGEVYRAQDTRLERIVALKILQSQLMTDAEHLKRFRREAKAASALNHPNIATIYDVGEAEGIHYLVMEFVEGQTLAEKLKKGPMEVQEALKIGIHTAEALESAHGKGIVHRDIKPANLMITPEGWVKVLDFGLAKQARQRGVGQSTVSQTTPGIVMGTVEYMSPEQVLGHEVDRRTDLFSLGVTMYDMVAGRLPFQGTTPTETMDQILHREPESLVQYNKRLPVGLEPIIRKCLEKEQDLRYQTASDLSADLKRLRRDTEKVVAAVAVPEPRRGQYITALAILVAVAALAVASWLWINRPGPAIDETQLTPVPLTSYSGDEVFPSFSPDGNQVAFQWNGERKDNWDIYVKQIGEEPPSRLTNDPTWDACPAWSPDGKTIAFLRGLLDKKMGLMLIPQRGGQERILGELSPSDEAPHVEGPWLAWTPDSKWLACVVTEAGQKAWALFLFSVETGEKRRLTNPPTDIAGGDTTPAFSPDGGTLAFTRFRERGETADLYLLHLGKAYGPLGDPERIVLGNSTNFGAVWMPNGREIIYTSNPLIGEALDLWRMMVSKPATRKRLAFAPGDSSMPAVSLQGNRLAFAKTTRADTNIWRIDLTGPRRVPSVPVQFISSTKA